MLDYIVNNIGPNLVNVNIKENSFCETKYSLTNDSISYDKLDNILKLMPLYNNTNNDSLISIILDEIEPTYTVLNRYEKIKYLKDFKIKLKEELDNQLKIKNEIDDICGYRLNLLEYISKIFKKSFFVINEKKLIENGDTVIVIEKNKYNIWCLIEKTGLHKYKISKPEIQKNLNKLLVKDLRKIAGDLGINIKDNNNKFLLKTELRDKIKSLL